MRPGITFPQDAIHGHGLRHTSQRLLTQCLTGKVSLDEPVSCLAGHHAVRFRQVLKPRCHVGCAPQSELLVVGTASHIADPHEAGVDAHPNGEPHAFLPFQLGDQRLHRVEHAQPRPHGPLGIVFVCLGPPEVDQQRITEELGDMAVKTLDDLGTGLLICPYDLPQLFGVALFREGR